MILELREGVATITLNRPEVFNALNLTMAEELVCALQGAMDNSSVRAVIVTGAGRGSAHRPSEQHR